MSPAELADAWESMAEQSIATAENTRSLDLYVREHACAKQLRQCAMQLRMTLGLPRDAAPLGDESRRDAIDAQTLHDSPGADL